MASSFRGVPRDSLAVAFPKRSRIPTVAVPLVRIGASATNVSATTTAVNSPSASSCRGGRDEEFLAYLLSNEQRLPSDRRLRMPTANADEYNTFVGEDDISKSATADKDEGEEQPVPSFVDFVSEIESAFLEVTGCAIRDGAVTGQQDTDFGVVVCGATCSADDVGWATSTRSLRCGCLYDVFSVLRNSTKLLQDVEDQAAPFATTASTTADAAVADSVVDENTHGEPRWCFGGHEEGIPRIFLTRFVNVFPGNEFRAFVLVPWRQSDNDDRDTNVHAVGRSGSARVVGICQRVVDQVFDHTAAWSERDSRHAFAEMEALLTCAKALAMYKTEAQRLRKELKKDQRNTTDHDEDDATVGEFVLFAVDLVYESPRLPVYVLGAGCKQSACDNLWTRPPAPGDNDWAATSMAAADPDAESYRLFVSEADLAKQFWHLQGQQQHSGGGGPMSVFVATQHDDLVGDARKLGAAAGGGADVHSVPLELQRPEMFQDNPEVHALIQRVMADQQRSREQQQQ